MVVNAAVATRRVRFTDMPVLRFLAGEMRRSGADEGSPLTRLGAGWCRVCGGPAGPGNGVPFASPESGSLTF
ncbi:hypothetical protein GCM10017750_12730 [Streptomyces racemochromogenes]